MTAGVLALALVATSSEANAANAERSPTLELDVCLQVDESVVQNLVQLELGDVRTRQANAPIAVAVRCIEGGQEIRVEPWASRGDDGIRTIALPDADDAAAALEARSRELALAIAELIRRLEITRPLPAEAPPPPPPPPPPIVAVPIAPPEAPPGLFGIAALSSFEYFTGGQWLAGGDLALTVALGRWALGDLRVGGRFAGGETLPAGRLSTRAGTAALGAGLNTWSNRRTVGFALMFRAQGYAVEYRAELPDAAHTAVLGAFVVAVEPRLIVAVTRRISIAAGGAAGLPLHGIVVRTQGFETDSMSGLVLSGNLGLVVAL